MPTRIAFTLVDVFTSQPFGGNQLAVFHNAGRLAPGQMQSLAHEMNFSESTFVIRPARSADPIRVRIFTPRRETPMAGHPTVGTAWVMATRRGADRRRNPAARNRRHNGHGRRPGESAALYLDGASRGGIR